MPVLVIGVRGGIEAARVEGVAAPDALDAEPGPAQGAEALDAGRRVVRAGRLETAGGAEKAGQRELVVADQQQKRRADHRDASAWSLPAARCSSARRVW